MGVRSDKARSKEAADDDHHKAISHSAMSNCVAHGAKCSSCCMQDRKAATPLPPAAPAGLAAQVEKVVAELPGEGMDHLQAQCVVTCTQPCMYCL